MVRRSDAKSKVSAVCFIRKTFDSLQCFSFSSSSSTTLQPETLQSTKAPEATLGGSRHAPQQSNNWIAMAPAEMTTTIHRKCALPSIVTSNQPHTCRERAHRVTKHNNLCQEKQHHCPPKGSPRNTAAVCCVCSARIGKKHNTWEAPDPKEIQQIINCVSGWSFKPLQT